MTVAVAPTETAGYLVIDPGTSNAEIVKYTGVSGTTITGLTRGLAFNGTSESAVAANQKSHSASAEVWMADAHYYLARVIDVLRGSIGTQYDNLYVGNSANNNITIYADNGDTNRPFIRYSAASDKWYISNNGTDVVDIAAGGSGVTAGNGIDLNAGAIDIDPVTNGGLKFSAVSGDQQIMIDTAGSLIFLQSSSGSADAAKVPTLSAYGNSARVSQNVLPYDATETEIDQLCDGINNSATASNLNVLVLGPSSDASALHEHLMSTAVATRGITTASGDQNIAHSLGKAPKYVLIHVVADTPAGGVGISRGFSDGSNHRCVFVEGDGTDNDSGSSSSKCVTIYADSSSNMQEATAAFDATNVILTWTKTGSPTGGNMQIIIEAYA